jgi:hypothetical protein
MPVDAINAKCDDGEQNDDGWIADFSNGTHWNPLLVNGDIEDSPTASVDVLDLRRRDCLKRSFSGLHEFNPNVSRATLSFETARFRH